MDVSGMRAGGSSVPSGSGGRFQEEARVARKSCLYPATCLAVGRGGPCRICDAAAIARRAVALRERIAANRAEGRPPYAPRTGQGRGRDLGG